MGLGALTVQRWDPAYAANGWTLYGAELTLDMGYPFGSMFYRNDADGRVLRVGVKWHPPVQQLEFPALHPSKPELTSDCTAEEVAGVVLDARSRIGTLVAVNAQIGSFVATDESENAILDASGLGLERLAEDDPRLADRDAARPSSPVRVALMGDRQWVQDIRREQTILSLPFGLGWTVDITQTLVALEAAGCPLVWRRSTGSGSRTAGPGSCPPEPDRDDQRRRRPG